ncbi:MAG: hypothetical protein E6614_00130 [Bradyrhizobium sp.]|jgi:hypothetical protein|uniref:Uncharacterized protein n=1 Tax=Bradyrhizobium denitrificans TaxID=2734912 RepID=A0ABS5GK07_9BRAD|nr:MULTISPECIES: hypothetical protein [Bradyrhizobium]MDU2920805.1 hypothetical protein [Klebsiella quasipneumoniae]MDU6442942.1 hypothetical protein [Pantoea sp.]MDU6561205.1 hypothetical protein [Streptococcus vestibularis]MBR1141490.1 hypothetical protein [Bradyrhizobium denitrificans]MDU0953572.1 hypothetical protein [Bradyrhizobium sp.]
MSLDSLTAAIDRFFRSYFSHCVTPDEDTLLNLLNALHGLNDKLQKDVGRNLFASTISSHSKPSEISFITTSS